MSSQKFLPGHRACAGCGLPLAVRTILDATDKPIVAVVATGCLEITTTGFPSTSWGVPVVHSLFENTAAVASGVEAAVKVLAKKKKFDRPPKIVAFAGDGGTYDIGLQALSGALERRHDFVFVCLDNEGYMNTGYQRSSASPLGAATSTTPAGKPTPRKDILKIVAAHEPAYAATSTVGHIADLKAKAAKAFAADGPAFLNVFSPCPTNWKSNPADGLKIARAAVETNFWPLTEFENSTWKLSSAPAERLSIEEFLKNQKRFAAVLKSPEKITAIQKEVDERFASLKKLTELA